MNIIALQLQSRSYWKVYVMQSSRKKCSSRVDDLLNFSRLDGRVKLLLFDEVPSPESDIFQTLRIALDRVDSSCKYVTITSPGIKYGTKVVEDILQISSEAQTEIEVIFSPWESAVIAEAGDWPFETLIFVFYQV